MHIGDGLRVMGRASENRKARPYGASAHENTMITAFSKIPHPP